MKRFFALSYFILFFTSSLTFGANYKKEVQLANIDKQIKTEYIEKCKEGCSVEHFTGKLSELNDNQIKELSSKLELKAFDFVANDTQKDITKFLVSRLEKLLGVDDSKTLKEKKVVDQKDFAEIYKNQLNKNVLLEIMAYCKEKKSENDDLNRIDLSEKEVSVEKIINSSADETACIGAIKTDCDSGQEAIKTKACLLMARLREYKKTIAQTDLVIKSFGSKESGTSLTSKENFVAGSEKNNTYDRITNYTSKDFNTKDITKHFEKKNKEFAECKNDKDPAKCKNFIAFGNDEKLNEAMKIHQFTTAVKLTRLNKLEGKDFEDAMKGEFSSYLSKEDQEKLKAGKMSPEDINKVKTAVSEKFEKERNEIHQAIKLERDNSFSKNDQNDKLTDLKGMDKEIDPELNKIRNTILYNNLAQRSLGTQNEKKEISGNTAPASFEAEDLKDYAIAKDEIKEAIGSTSTRAPADTETSKNINTKSSVNIDCLIDPEMQECQKKE